VINRRTTLLTLAAACGTALSLAACGRSAESDSTAPAAGAAKAGGDDDLRDNVARMGTPREDSEVGVPVFLACEDLVAEQAGKPGAPPNPFSAQIAADLRRFGDEWLRLHPDAKEEDVARLIQILADRDFVRGAKGGAA
jgi:hypothetical protein